MQALLDTLASLERPTGAQRLFHGRGGLHPGSEAWALDFYEPVWLLTHFGPEPDGAVARIGQVLTQRWQQIAPDEPLCWVFQCRHEGRSHTRCVAGELPQPHVVTEHGARYLVHLERGQNHGLFLDMAEGRRWVHEWAGRHPGGRVLNLFAYTCAFSVAALRGGAASVVNLDMADGALAIGRRNHALNGLTHGASFLAHDLFNSWGKLTRGGPYDLVIVDPPSYQKGSFVATKDYARLVRRLPELLSPGAHALLCLNAPELGEAFVHQHVEAQAPGLRRLGRLPNPSAFADVSSDRALKVLVYQREG